MIRFRRLRIKRKLAVTFFAVILPLLAAEGLAIGYYRSSARGAAELELTNVVNHLYRVCEIVEESRPPPGAPVPPFPSPQELRFLKSVFTALKVGSTGYPYCMDSRGNLVLHPFEAGRNIIESRDSKGFPFIQDICARALRLGPGEVGTIRYPWRNEEAGEVTARMKILKFRYVEALDWIIAAGSYEEEIFWSAERLGLYTAPLVLASLVLVVTLVLGMNRMITRPLNLLSDAATRMAGGDLSARVELGEAGGEFSDLGRSFNAMAGEIWEKTANLERLVEERTHALEESRERYRSLVHSTVDGIVTSDLHGVITFVNPGLEAMLGHSREEMVGRRLWEYYTGGKETARTIMQLLREQGNLVNYELEMIGRSGVVPIRSSASILRDSRGEEHGTLGIFSDLTAEKKLQADLRQVQADLIQSTKLRALGDLVAGVAHEINNPLMALGTMVYLMEQADCPAGCPNRGRLPVLHRCRERIAKIVDHLKEFSRQSRFEREQLDLNLPLENALILTGQQLLNHGIDVQKELAPDLPAILGDVNHLEQLFLNVIGNARDALDTIEEPRVLVLRSFATEMDGQAAAAVDVEDNGPGIPPEIRDKIFEPFFTTKEVGRGTGLGLAISYGIVEEHGGRIEVSSGSAGGTRFRVIVPAAPPTGPGAGQEQRRAKDGLLQREIAP